MDRPTDATIITPTDQTKYEAIQTVHLPATEVPDSKIKRLDTGKHLWRKSHHFRCIYTQHQSRSFSLQTRPQDHWGGKAQAHNHTSDVGTTYDFGVIFNICKICDSFAPATALPLFQSTTYTSSKYTAITIRIDRDDTNHGALKVI